MKTHFFIAITLLLTSCSEKPATQQQPEISSETEMEPPKPKPAQFPKDLPSVTEFPGVEYQKAVAYELTGRPGGEKAATVFRNQTGVSVELDSAQIGEFLDLINDPKSYGESEHACFDPGIGLVFYDENDEVVAYLSLCLQCHNMRSEPPLDLGFYVPSKSGFAKRTHGKLFHLFNDWGIKHEKSHEESQH